MNVEISKSTAQQVSQAAMAANPANAPQTCISEEDRVPMSLPTLRLAAPEMPGYFLYWHLGKNVGRALRAGYTFVDESEVNITQRGVANSVLDQGSTDMGTRISVEAGGYGDQGTEPERLYLMKLPEAWRQKDQTAQARVNESVAIALRAGTIGADDDPDKNKRYMKKGQDLFYPKRRSV